MKQVLMVVLLLGLAACAAPPSIAPLPTTGRVDYQLGGAWTPPDDVTVVARDSTEPPLAGVYSICYLNGFQTQPQETEFWLEEHPTLVLRDSGGDPLIDENWPDEMALDTSTAAKRAALAAIMGEWITGCRDNGYQAVEFDNLDSYTRFDGLTLEGNLALATELVRHAHSVGLAAGQKNGADLGTRGRDEVGFDFVVSEECFVFDECATYADVFGDQFIDIEYQRYEPGEFDGLCSDPDVPHLTIVRDRGLSPGDDPDTVFWSCDI